MRGHWMEDWYYSSKVLPSEPRRDIEFRPAMARGGCAALRRLRLDIKSYVRLHTWPSLAVGCKERKEIADVRGENWKLMYAGILWLH